MPRRQERSAKLLKALAWSAIAAIVFLPGLLVLAHALGALPGLVSAGAPAFSARALTLLGRSVLLAGGATAAAAVLGTLAAFGLEGARLPAWVREGLRALALAGLFLPPYYQVAVWRPALEDFLAAGEGARLLIAASLLGLAHAPIVLLFAAHGVRSVKREVIEEAALAGCGRWRLFRSVLLPLAAPALAAAAALVFLLALLNYEVPALLFLNTYPVELLLAYQSRPDLGEAAALALPFLLAAGAVAALLRRCLDRVDWSMEGESSGGAWPMAGSLSAALAVAVVFFLALFPLARLLAMAGGWRFAGVAAGVLTAHGGELLAGAGVSAAALATALVLAFLAAPRSGRTHPLLGALLWLPLALPGPLLGAAMVRTYNRPFIDAIYSSSAILVLAGVARFFPIAYHALSAHLRSVPRELWEAAALSPQGRLRRLLRVDVPLAAPGLALAGAAFLIFQSAEVGAAVLLAPPGASPVPLTVYALLHYNTELEIPAALCLFQLAAALLMIGLLRWGAGLAGGIRRRKAR
jgi:iron(III) transport system permease protein